MKEDDHNNGNRLVVKANALINASYTLSLVEQRLILLAITESRRLGLEENKKQYEIHASLYGNQFGVTESVAYKALKEAAQNLFERQFSYTTRLDNGRLKYSRSRWVQKISYVEESGLVELVFADDVVPLISRLEKQFTSYDLAQVSTLTSVYAIRLYELISSWRSMSKTPIYSYEDIREKLGVEQGLYAIKADFKKRVLEIAINQINDHTDIKVKLHQHKTGRVISGYSFSFKPQVTVSIENEQEPINDPNTIDMFSGFTEKQLDYYVDKLATYPEVISTAPVGVSLAEFKTQLRNYLEVGFNIEHKNFLLEQLRKNGVEVYGR